MGSAGENNLIPPENGHRHGVKLPTVQGGEDSEPNIQSKRETIRQVREVFHGFPQSLKDVEKKGMYLNRIAPAVFYNMSNVHYSRIVFRFDFKLDWALTYLLRANQTYGESSLMITKERERPFK